MTALISFFQNSVAYIVPMIVLLGLLIFVHELGHFLVAKYFKVRVETFSLGFGPKLLKFKRGDTTYAISAIPLGGYVKMFGDDPGAAVPEEMKQQSFIHKPVWQRIWIVLAGPLMNFFFAIAVFASVAVVGEPVLAPKVGDVKAETPAFQAGFRSGDTITKVNGEEVKTWDKMQNVLEENGEREVKFEVKREGSGEVAEFTARPKTVRNKNVLSWAKEVGEIEGLSYNSLASVVGIHDLNSAAAQGGLKTGDIVTEVNGVKVDKWRELGTEISKNLDAPIKLKVQRNQFDGAQGSTSTKAPITDESALQSPVEAEVTITPPADAKGLSGDEALRKLGVEFPETYLAGFDKTSPAKEAGLQFGDKIVKINDQPIPNFEAISKIVRSFGTAGDEAKVLKIAALRDGKPVEVTVTPHMKERMNNQGREEARFEIGIKPMIFDSVPQTIELATSSPVGALSRGWDQTMKWTSLTVLSFVRLFQNEVSAKNIGGFISIGQMAKRSWQVGLAQFLNIMAIISINLFILNLLPVPVLDGGHLVFYSFEAIRGEPLSMRWLERAQQVGLILLLGLMAFALVNDVTRLFN